MLTHMDDFAGIFTLLVFLFYAAIAAAFILVAVRNWVWPYVRERLPLGQPLEQDHRIQSGDREHSTSQP